MLFNLKRILICIIAVSALSNAKAYILEPAAFGAQAQIMMNSGNVSGCGLLLFGHENNNNKGFVNIFNGSVIFSKTGTGLVKYRISRIDQKKLNSPNFSLKDLAPVRVKNLWIKSKNSTATRPISSVAESDNEGYFLYASKNTDDVLLSILIGEEIQIGLDFFGNDISKILYSKVDIPEGDKNQILQCMQELIKK